MSAPACASRRRAEARDAGTQGQSRERLLSWPIRARSAHCGNAPSYERDPSPPARAARFYAARASSPQPLIICRKDNRRRASLRKCCPHYGSAHPGRQRRPLRGPPALRRGILAGGLVVLAIDRYSLFERHPFALLSAYTIAAILLGRRPEGCIAVLATITAALLLLPWAETFLRGLGTFALFFLVLLHEHERTVRRGEVAEAARTEAETARAAAEVAVRQRDDFLAAAAHDLRTTLTAVVGHTELLAAPDATPAAQRHVAPLARAAWRLRGAVEGIIDASVLQAGHDLSPDRELVELGALAREVTELAAAAGPLGHGAVRVLQHLADNALNYSAPGQEVSISVTVRERGDCGSQRDDQTDRDGHGDREPDWAKIVRAQGAATRRTICRISSRSITVRPTRCATAAGQGIGLTSAKRIVEEHGGRIALASADGAGTTVAVSLPRPVLGAD